MITVQIEKYNPVTYRGYYYDNDLEMYYLQSRYYNPQWGRFLNADDTFDPNAGVLSANLYAYCANNPVMYIDKIGTSITVVCIIGFTLLGATAGSIAGYRLARYYNVAEGQRWKYVLGGIVIGSAAGALLGWGAGVALSANAVKTAAMALFGKVVTSGGMLVSVARQMFEKTQKVMSLNQVKQLITLCQKYGVDITVRLTDLTEGHAGTPWNIPHIHLGANAQVHIAVTRDAIEYLREIFGI